MTKLDRLIFPKSRQELHALPYGEKRQAVRPSLRDLDLIAQRPFLFRKLLGSQCVFRRWRYRISNLSPSITWLAHIIMLPTRVNVKSSGRFIPKALHECSVWKRLQEETWEPGTFVFIYVRMFPSSVLQKWQVLPRGPRDPCSCAPCASHVLLCDIRWVTWLLSAWFSSS